LFEGRDIVLRRRPDLVKIDAEVSMGQKVAHSNNLRPWD
jgi:hypothetical protein